MKKSAQTFSIYSFIVTKVYSEKKIKHECGYLAVNSLNVREGEI
jgi:hypothetical protein